MYQLRTQEAGGKAVNNYNHITEDGYALWTAGDGNNEWFYLFELKKEEVEPYFAEKISVQDLQEEQKVILYKSVYNQTSGTYEDYVIDGNGNLLKAYDKGDKVVGYSSVDPYWKVIMYKDAITGEYNGYYDF